MANNGNQIKDMRDILFAQLQRLSDPNCDLDKELPRTQAIVGVSKTLVESAKVEVDFMRVTGQQASSFIPTSKQIGDGKKGKNADN